MPRKPTRPRAAVTPLLIAATVPAAARAQTLYFWDGGSPTTNNFTAAANWVGDVLPPQDGTAALTFANSIRTSPNVDTPFFPYSLHFHPNAAPFTLTGVSLHVGAGGISSADPDTHTLGPLVALTAPQTWTSSAGALRFTGHVNAFLQPLTLAPTGAGSITLAGGLSGSAPLVASGTVSISPASRTFSGSITVPDGNVSLLFGSTSYSGPVTVGDSAGATASAQLSFFGDSLSPASPPDLTIHRDGSLRLSGALLNVRNLSLTGAPVNAPGSSNTIRLSGDIVAHASPQRASVIGAGIELLGPATRVLNIDVADGADPYDLVIHAPSFYSSSPGPSARKTGPGALAISTRTITTVPFTLAEGTFALFNDGTAPTTATATLTLAGGTLASVQDPINLRNPLLAAAPSTIDTLTPLTLAGSLSGSAPLTKTGAGTLTLFATGVASHAYAGTLTVSAGTLRLLTSNTQRAAYVTAPGATIIVDSPQTISTLHSLGTTTIPSLLTLAPDSGPSTITSLPTTTTGRIDLTNNPLILLNTAPLDARTLIVNARLFSSTPDPNDLLSLGYIPTPSGGVLVRLTLTGDANLNGIIDADDFALTDRGPTNTRLTFWYQGDFNHDGARDAQDYHLLDRAYLLTSAQASPLLGPLLAQRQAQFGPAYVQHLLASIPEPSLPTSLVATLPLLRRRHRRRHNTNRRNFACHNRPLV